MNAVEKEDFDLAHSLKQREQAGELEDVWYFVFHVSVLG